MSYSTRLAASALVSAIGVLSMSSATMADMLKSIGPGEGEVAIVAWPGYIERGESDKNYDWVTDFEKQTGCKVNVKVAGTSDEMVTLMNGGGFDLVTASGDASLRLVAGKTVQHAFLGIRYSALTPEIAQQYNIDTDHGLVVEQVQAGTPAEQAGLKPGDVIISVDGKNMNQIEDLIAVLHQHAPGDTVAIVIERDNQQQTLQATLGNQ